MVAPPPESQLKESPISSAFAYHVRKTSDMGACMKGTQPAGRETGRAQGRFLGTLVHVACVIVLVVALCVVSLALHAPGKQDAAGAAELVPVGTVRERTHASKRGVDVSIAMVGDVLMHEGVYQSGLTSDGSYNFDHVFAHVKDAIKGCDLKIVNQETPLGGDVAPFSGYPQFNGPQQMGDAEANAGFNVVLKATNHAMDVGYPAIKSELAFWARRHPGVAVVGMRDPDASTTSVPNGVYVYEKDGFRVAVLNFTFSLNGIADPKGAVSMLEEGHVREAMAYARANADMLVVCPHWGTEYVTEPTETQRRWERLFVECGADVIIGGHPHVIEPVEEFQSARGGTGVCFWSVGNFVSMQRDDACMIGGMAKVTLHKDPDGSCRVVRYALVPLVTHKVRDRSLATYLLSDYTDALAATSANPTCTPEWAQGYVANGLGQKYDPAAGSLSVELG